MSGITTSPPLLLGPSHAAKRPATANNAAKNLVAFIFD
jgi:hypothetical protein